MGELKPLSHLHITLKAFFSLRLFNKIHTCIIRVDTRSEHHMGLVNKVSKVLKSILRSRLFCDDIDMYMCIHLYNLTDIYMHMYNIIEQEL